MLRFLNYGAARFAVTRRRRAAAVLAPLLAVTVLSSCTKPLPTITVFSGSTATKVSAQPRCAIVTNRCKLVTSDIPELSAKGGGQILVDVPRKLAHAGWIVSAFTADSAGKNTPVPGAGSTAVSGDHAVRVNVPLSTGGYFIGVYPTNPAAAHVLTAWLVSVHIAQ